MARLDVRKLARTLQVEVPFAVDLKFGLMRSYRARTGALFEADFAAIPLLDPPAGALFLDVGANRGQSIEAILHVHPTARIESFEPNLQLAARLSGRFAGDDRVIVNNIGLGDVAEERDLFVPFYKRYMFDGLGSFDEASARDWLDGEIYGFDRAKVTLARSRCRVERLDDRGLAPFFVKIDVQGFEVHVLRGARGMLDVHRPHLLIETPSEEIVAFLAELDYEPCAYRDGDLVAGELGALNTLFVQPSRRRPDDLVRTGHG